MSEDNEVVLSGPLACERPLAEIMALSTAIYALGSADLGGTDNGPIRNGEALATLAWMIQDRVLLIDKNIWPEGPIFEFNLPSSVVAARREARQNG